MAVPFLRRNEPVLSVKIHGNPVQALVDSGAHVSVVPYSVIQNILEKPPERYPDKSIRAFGGIPVNLKGPVNLTIQAGKTAVIHPFYFTMANTPNILGYDLMKSLGIILDSTRNVVWLKPNMAQGHLHDHNYNAVIGGNSTQTSQPQVQTVQSDSSSTSKLDPAAKPFVSRRAKSQPIRQPREQQPIISQSSQNTVNQSSFSQSPQQSISQTQSESQGSGEFPNHSADPYLGCQPPEHSDGLNSSKHHNNQQLGETITYYEHAHPGCQPPEQSCGQYNNHPSTIQQFSEFISPITYHHPGCHPSEHSDGLYSNQWHTSQQSNTVFSHFIRQQPGCQPSAKSDGQYSNHLLDTQQSGEEASQLNDLQPSHQSSEQSVNQVRGQKMKNQSAQESPDHIHSPPRGTWTGQPPGRQITWTEEPSTVTQVLSIEEVPEHPRELYDTTVESTTLSEIVDDQFKGFLRKYESTFANSKLDMGYCSLLQHDIDTGHHPPIRQSPRKPPLSSGDAEEKEIQDMLTAGVIEPSMSAWASPVVLAKKPDGSYRFCVDYRKVNAVSKFDAFPVPDLRDALDNLRGATCFATIDLLSGYWQLGLTERAKERSAFCTKFGLFQFCRMPFGLSGAPATFCRLMARVLNGLLYKICISYIDDVIVYARSNTELLERLDEVFDRFKTHGLKVKPSKCVFFRKEIAFLGHIVNQHGIQPQPEKLTAIQQWPTPRCLREVRAFVGLASYYRRFVSNFAAIAEPLTSLTKTGTKFKWTEATQEAFNKLRGALLNTPILAFPYPNLPCILDTDASDVAIGGVLSQIVDGKEQPIAFFSRVMNDTQRRYCATRRELLAVIAALQHFRHYLLNVHIILRTDHHSLKWLRTFKNPEGILARWIETLAEFDYSIEHRPGKLHCNADALSRQQCKQCWGHPQKTPWVDELERAEEIALNAIQLLPEITEEEMIDMQEQDLSIEPVKRLIQSTQPPTTDQLREFPPEARSLWTQRHRLTVINNILIRTGENNNQLIVPEPLRNRLFYQAHAGPLAAHLAAERTLAQLQANYYWPGMAKDVKAMCQECQTCAAGKHPPSQHHGKLQKVLAAAPMDLVAVDVLSGLPTATDGSKCILVAVDYYTKWVEAYSLPNEEASTCMKALYEGFFARFGFPQQLHSDQGRNFESRLFAEMTKLAGIRRTRTTAFHPQSDGQTERMNRTLLQMLRATAQENPNEWPEKLPTVLAAYRMTPHKVTKISPNEAMLNRSTRCPCTLIASPPSEGQDKLTPFASNFRRNMRTVHDRIRRMTKLAAKTQKTYYDNKTRALTFHKGQWVYLYQPNPLIRQKHRKLQQLWTGPHEITEIKSDIVVMIKNIKNNKHKCVHIDRLWPFHNTSIPPTAATTSQTPTTTPTMTEHQTATPPDRTDEVDIPHRPIRCRRRPARLQDYDTT